jgi:hypothetical protein
VEDLSLQRIDTLGEREQRSIDWKSSEVGTKDESQPLIEVSTWCSICSSGYKSLGGKRCLEHSELPKSESRSESQSLVVGEAWAVDLVWVISSVQSSGKKESAALKTVEARSREGG